MAASMLLINDGIDLTGQMRWSYNPADRCPTRIYFKEDLAMAKGRNIILHGFSGRLGDTLVIRQRGGETILSAAPGERDTEPTEAQKVQQRKFQEAIIYGKTQMADAASKAEYEARADEMRSAFNVAVADFFNAPEIDEVDVTAYNGSAGSSIRVRAVDDFKVEQVHVSISNDDGSLVEAGDAVLQDNGLDWVYTATADNTETSGDKIVVRVSDKPGNITENETTL